MLSFKNQGSMGLEGAIKSSFGSSLSEACTMTSLESGCEIGNYIAKA